MGTIREQFLQHLGQTNDFPLLLEIERAEGFYQYDKAGKRYLDLISGIAVANIGHHHPVVVEALKKQADQHLHIMVYGEFIQNPQVEYATWLSEHLPPSLQCTYFTNSGAEAIEAAMKLAKRLTGRPNMVSFQNAYHGSTQGALSLAGGEELKQAYRPLLPNCTQLPYNDFKGLSAINHNTACVVVEAVQGESGATVPSHAFLKALKTRCEEMGALMVLDEIQTGFGRTGKLWAFEHSGVVPDMITLGKALGGGMPLGALVTSTENMAAFKNQPVLGHITTFGGHPMSCAAGLAANKWLVQQELTAKVESTSQWLKAQLSPFKVNGKGLLLSVELGSFERVQHYCKTLVQKGFITDWFLFNMHSLRLAPPLTITPEALKPFVEAMHEIASEE